MCAIKNALTLDNNNLKEQNMSDVMPIEQAEFIDNLQRWFNESTNMCHEDCYRFAFIVWQHKEYLSKTLGYEKGIEDALYVACDKGYITSDDEEYLKSKIPEWRNKQEFNEDENRIN